MSSVRSVLITVANLVMRGMSIQWRSSYASRPSFDGCALSNSGRRVEVSLNSEVFEIDKERLVVDDNSIGDEKGTMYSISTSVGATCKHHRTHGFLLSFG